MVSTFFTSAEHRREETRSYVLRWTRSQCRVVAKMTELRIAVCTGLVSSCFVEHALLAPSSDWPIRVVTTSSQSFIFDHRETACVGRAVKAKPERAYNNKQPEREKVLDVC